MTDYVQKKIAPGVELLAVPAGRFKTNELAIHLAVPMEEQMAANYALAISAVSRKGKAYPDMRALHLQLDKLYGAAISVTANKSGGCQILKMGITTLDDLDEEALIRILTEPKNALVKQYQKLFDFDDIELELTGDALNAIAAEAIARKTGARGLRSIMEGTLMDTMYTTPSVENVKKIVVDADCVKGTAKPRFYDASGKEITNVPQGI